MIKVKFLQNNEMGRISLYPTYSLWKPLASFQSFKKKAVKVVCISIETWRGREEEMHEVMHQVVYVYMYTELFKIRFATFVANTLPHI